MNNRPLTTEERELLSDLAASMKAMATAAMERCQDILRDIEAMPAPSESAPMRELQRGSNELSELEPLTQDTIDYIAAEVSHDYRCADPQDGEQGANRIRWNNRCVARLLNTLHREREQHAREAEAIIAARKVCVLWGFAMNSTDEETRDDMSTPLAEAVHELHRALIKASVAKGGEA